MQSSARCARDGLKQGWIDSHLSAQGLGSKATEFAGDGAHVADA